MRLSLSLLLGMACCFSVARPVSAALVVLGFTPERHDRFENSASFVGSPFDWSGVGRSDTGSWGTLISPSFVLSATHAPSGGNLRFYRANDPSGGAAAYVERTVVAGAQIDGSDLYLARLSAPIDAGAGITAYEIAQFQATSYVGREIYTFGLSSGTFGVQADQRLGRNRIDGAIANFSRPILGAAAGDVIVYDYAAANGFSPDESLVQSGDSGGPSFTIVGNRPTVVGMHWFQYFADANTPNPGSGDTFVSSYIDELNSAMFQLTPAGQSIESVRTATIMAVPEPSSLALVSLLFVLAGSRCRPLRSVS